MKKGKFENISSSQTQKLTDDKLIYFFDVFNKLFQANLGKFTFGISPAAIGSAFYTWYLQLLQSPGHLLSLAFYPFLHAAESLTHLVYQDDVEETPDIRFSSEHWQVFPWSLYSETFLQIENWWKNATTDIPGVSKHVERTISFCTRQVLDAFSPSNFIFSNPDLLHATIQSGGVNLIQGTQLAFDNTLRKMVGLPPPGASQFIPGKNVAITPGKIVYQNHLIELIQYEATTQTVYREPILIIPAWIMKYYILDLSPHNSLVKWLVAKGHTVFIISWRNPDKRDRDLCMDDYYRLGAISALDYVHQHSKKAKIHLMGYCLGGTLAMLTLAAMSKNKDNRVKTLSLLAAQSDFTQAGELMLFISESEIDFLKSMMWEKGYLDTKQMSGAFQMLRSYDLIWSKMIDDYMHGKERGMIDLLAWNADATRMPYQMHIEYLERLFLKNQFAEGHFKIEGDLVTPKQIHVPIFAVSTEKDHVAPWKSVYKTNLLTNTDFTFVLTNGGHNAGIISEPGHPNRFYWIKETPKNVYLGPQKWLNQAQKKEGSWWSAWQAWLVKHSSVNQITKPKLAPSLPNAPGTYIFQK